MTRPPPICRLFPYTTLFRSPAMQAGADVMKRIATPMIGGVLSSAVLNLLIYPVIYVIDQQIQNGAAEDAAEDRKSTRLNSSHLGISYAVFCLKTKTWTHLGK